MQKILSIISEFLDSKLELKLNPKTNIFKAKNGVDFVGYRHWHTHKKIRKANLKRMYKRIKKINRLYADNQIDFEKINKSIQSFLGHIKHADTYNFRRKMLNNIKLVRKEQ